MNILIINYEYPPIGGGAGKQCSLLAKELSKKNKIFVLTSNFNHKKDEEKNINKNLVIIRIDVGRKFLYKANIFEMLRFVIKGLKKSKEIVQNNNIDISLAFFAVPSGLISLALKSLYNIPYIVSLRGFDVPGHLTKEYGLLQLFILPLLRLVLNNSEKNVAVSKYLALLAQKITPDKKIEVIPNSIEKVLNHKIYNKSETVTIITIGRLTPQKKFDDLLRSISLIDKSLKLRLYIAGDGPERKNLEKLTNELKIKNKIKFLGWVNKYRIEKLYRKADIFVMPSVEEGMSNVALEALSFGLPIVAVNILSNSGIICDGYNGYLIPLKNTKKFSEKISYLISNPKIRNYFSANSISLAKKFKLNKMAKSYLTLLSEVTSNKNNLIFDFGENWINYTKNYLNENNIKDAKTSLLKIFNKKIKGKTFLDIGCGSGLFSLAALKLGAKKVVSFDVNLKSVECCKYLKKIEGNPTSWEIKTGSILDKNFVSKLGKFDIVYSFGVLHHTGNMYKAINKTSEMVKMGGLLYIAIYNKTDSFGIYPLENFGSSWFWAKEKEIFTKAPSGLRNAIVSILSVFTKLFLPEKSNNRGMARDIDLKDWLGGYPYEYAGADEIFTFIKKLGFKLEYLKTNSALKNNEFLFKKNTL